MADIDRSTQHSDACGPRAAAAGHPSLSHADASDASPHSPRTGSGTFAVAGAGAGGAGAGTNATLAHPSTYHAAQTHAYSVGATPVGRCPATGAMPSHVRVKALAACQARASRACTRACTAPAPERASTHPPLPDHMKATVHREVDHAFATIMQMMKGEARHCIPAEGSLGSVFVTPKGAGEGHYTQLRVIVMRPDVLHRLLDDAPAATCPCVCFVGEPREGMMSGVEQQDARIVVGLGRTGPLHAQPVAAYLSIQHTSGQWYNMVLYAFSPRKAAGAPACPVRAGVDGWMESSRHGSIVPFAVRHFRWVYKPVGVIDGDGTFTVHGRPKSAVYDGTVG